MQWSLEDIYKKQVRGKIPPRRHLRVLGEAYDVRYKKENEAEFTDIKVDDESFQKAARYLKADKDLVSAGISKLQQTGLTDQQIKQLLNTVYNYDDTERFFAVLNNQMSANDFFNAPNKDIIQLVVDRYGLDKDLVLDLLQFEPATKPSTGKGETFMMIFIDGAKKGSVGDVDINGIEYEIKGSGARIRGQRGFGAQTTAARKFLSGIKELIQRAGLDLDIKNPNFNIGPKYNGFIDQVANELVQTGKVTKEDIARVYADGLKEVYENADIQNDLLPWLMSSLNENGNITENFLQNYFDFALKYYTNTENFNYLVTIGTTRNSGLKRLGKFEIVSREDILNGGYKDRVRPASFPSYLPSAGAQGGQFAIMSV
jgi:hypothetical protein